MKLAEQTGIVALVFFIIYTFYGIFSVPFPQYLTSLAVGGIAYGVSDSYEVAVIALFVMNFIFPMLSTYRLSMASGPVPYTGPAPVEPFTDTAQIISDRIAATRKAPRQGPGGMAGVMSEGFQDANDEDMTVDPEKKKPKNVKAAGSEKSSPASTSPEVENVDTDTPPVPNKISEQGVPPANQPQAAETFQDKSGLFKLGEIPKDEKGGFHIDAGTTVINAIKALKPDQISAMTQDTKQLIETQKSLMNMLQTFKPMMAEGKEMMNTFQTMFAPTMGATQTATDILQGTKE